MPDAMFGRTEKDDINNDAIDVFAINHESATSHDDDDDGDNKDCPANTSYTPYRTGKLRGSCYFSGRSCNTDPSKAIGKFYGIFNSILGVIGIGKNDMLAYHLVNI
jgi:hypothetical protein